MKKFIGLFSIVVILCGCGAQNKTEVSDISSNDGSSVVFEDADTVCQYKNFEEFEKSVFCEEMKKNNYLPYKLKYDESKYELLGIESDAHFYEYTLKDKTTEKRIIYSIIYDRHIKDSEDLKPSTTYDNDSFAKVKNNGNEYDVYLCEMPFVDFESYSLNVAPEDGYMFTISCVDAATKEDILAYFGEIEFIKSEG